VIALRFGLRQLFVLASLALVASQASSATGGVIFLYHHVAEDTPAATSVTPEAFAAQLDFLEREGFAVVPVLELLKAVAAGDALPDKTVALSFDDAYSSVLSAAVPELRSRGWPFTVFVNTAAIDDGYRGYLSWDELRVLGENGGTIGNHSVSHAHLVRELPGESGGDWRRRIHDEIAAAAERLEAEVGDYLVPVFAYPYGEYTPELARIVDEHGLFGLGQHSGAVGPASDLLAAPRYPIATGLGLSADDFALRARSRALPLAPAGPERHIVAAGEDRPAVELALATADDDIRLDELACYASGQGGMQIEWRDGRTPGAGEAGAFLVTPVRPLGPGRSKYNCTAPSRASPGVYYWYSWLWMKRRDDGAWYDE
jgi:peptidoglycan/xylan/chitin deacetylase (PgdA/CDA1 family)